MPDKYLSFNYKNASFSTTAYNLYNDFKGFVINEGVDLTFFNPSNFSHEFVTPQFASQSYFMGTTQENREFNFLILLQGVTIVEYKTFLRWLNPKQEGILWFDYNENYGYDVKVNSISEGKFMVDPNCISGVQNPTYNVELTVGFITKNDWAARWIGDEVKYELYCPSAKLDYQIYGGAANYELNEVNNKIFVYDSDSASEYLPKNSYSSIHFNFSDVIGYSLSIETLLGVYNYSYMSNFNIEINFDLNDDYWTLLLFENEILIDTITGIVDLSVSISLSRESTSREITITNNNNITDYYLIDWDYDNYEAFAIIINGTYKMPLEAEGTIYSQYGIAVNNGEFVLFDGEIEPFSTEPGESITIGYPETLPFNEEMPVCITIKPLLREII